MMTRESLKPFVRYFVVLLVGLVIGAWLFSDTQPRSVMNVKHCQATCAKFSDIAGLVASIGIQKFPALVPYKVKESDTCLAIRHPFSPHNYHFVLFPKRDIRNVGDISSGDAPYIMGCLAMMRSLIAENKLVSYRMYSNGPIEQDITYLHFHLVSD